MFVLERPGTWSVALFRKYRPVKEIRHPEIPAQILLLSCVVERSQGEGKTRRRVGEHVSGNARFGWFYPSSCLCVFVVIFSSTARLSMNASIGWRGS